MDFKFEIISSKTGDYIEIKSFLPGLESVEIPYEIDGIPILYISSVALVRNPSIHCFILPFCQDDFSIAKYILNNTSQRLRLIFRDKNNEFELTFPDYNDRAIEDTMARAIHFKIDGSGYAYRECVFRDHIDFVGYDMIFERGKEEPGNTPIDIALGRLMSPFRLDDKYKEKYEGYIQENLKNVIDYLIDIRDKTRFSFFIKSFNINKDTIGYALKKTSSLKLFEFTSLIMESKLNEK